MVEIRPFRPYTYNPLLFPTLDDLITQPYYLDPERRREFCRRSPYNYVRLILPPGNDYAIAARTLRRWMARGILVREPREGMWLYAQGFDNRWGRGMRKGVVAALRLHHPEEGVIQPHERIFEHFVLDRLKILEATGFHLEPIFFIVDSRELRDVLESSADGLARRATEPTNVWHMTKRLPEWAAEEAVRALRDRRVVIADGHHRFTAAMRYSELTGSKYVLAFIAPINDNDVLILPSHRVVRRSLGEKEWKSLRETFRISRVSRGEIGRCIAEDRIVLFDGEAWCLEPEGDLSAFMPPWAGEAYRSLPVSVVHHVIVEGILGLEDRASGLVSFTRTVEGGIEAVESGGGLAIFMRAVRPEEVMRVVDEGNPMPPKSTDFYPKLASGLFLMEAI